MLKVNGQAYVTNLKEVSPRLITGTVYSFEKVGEEFKTTFIKAKFVGEAITYLITNNVKEKDKVFIKSGVIKSNTETRCFLYQVSSSKIAPYDTKYVGNAGNNGYVKPIFLKISD